MNGLKEKDLRSRWNKKRDQDQHKNVFLALAPMYVTIFCALLLFSCAAAKSAQQITVQVPDEFAGTLQIDPCDRSASVDHILADAKGAAATSACPHRGDQITLIIVRAGKTYRVIPENVTIVRTGDGLPVRIQAAAPRR
jgi:hypothetical protein